MGARIGKDGEPADTGNYSESNFDAFAGFSGSLFAQAAYDEDDAEADRIYDTVDQAVEARSIGKKRPGQEMTGASGAQASHRPSIGNQFSDLKAELASVSAAEWDALPDVGDHTLKLTQKSRFADAGIAAPDSLLLANAGSGKSTALHAANAASAATPMAGLAGTRGGLLGSRLDTMADDVQGQTVVDPRGYMTGLGGLHVSSDAEIGDIKRARLLLSSVTSTNPKHAPGWISAARLEERAGKPVAARKVAAQGCQACPGNEGVWLESARLNEAHNAKVVLSQAVRALPESVAIWLAAAALEVDEARKKVVLRRALELVPGSVALWKAAVELEEAEDARVLLGRAVECAPTSADLWLALVRLETHENARKVLNRMRQALPAEPLTWIMGARLEEANNAPAEIIHKIVRKMLSSLAQAQVHVAREQWVQKAEDCEADGANVTCAALIAATIGLGVEEEDRMDTWVDDAEACLARAKVETARAVLAHALEVFPADRVLWSTRVALERTHGSPDTLRAVLDSAVTQCPKVEVFWLMAAKQAWTSSGAKGIAEARDILQRACSANPSAEAIWLAGVKLEWENGEVARARALLRKARGAAACARVWLKSMLLEYEVGDAAAALALADEALAAFPTAPKLYMLAGQICQQALANLERARQYFLRGRDKCAKSAPLWVLSAALEEALGLPNKARSLLETARVGLPTEETLWVAATRLERRTGNEQAATALLSRGIQALPASGALWAEDLLTCAKPAQKNKSIDALKHCDNNAVVVLAVARLFEQDRKTEKARKWLQRAVALQPRLGDAWAYLFAFELRALSLLSERDSAVEEEACMQQGVLTDIEARCVAAEPNRGELWNRVHKRIENHRLGPAQVLRRCVEEISSTDTSKGK